MQILSDPDEAGPVLTNIFKDFQSSIKHPEVYLSAQPKRAEKFKKITKGLYDLSVQLGEYKNDSNVLPELVLEDMDEEQIWQQLELRNGLMMPKFLGQTSKLLSLNTTSFTFKCETVGNSSESESRAITLRMESNSEEDGEEEEIIEDESENEAVPEMSSKKKKKFTKSSAVDDRFFKLDEMEEFLKAEDEKEFAKRKGKPIEDYTIDYFNDPLSDDEDEEGFKYAEFFDEEEEELSQEALDINRRKKSNKRKHSESGPVKDELSEDEDEELNEGENDEDADENVKEDSDESSNEEKTNIPKSSFEQRQDRLKQRIQEHEEVALGEKPWQLRGEIIAAGRPQNSLLEEILEFDSTTRPAPVITEETTLRLEDIIRQRIKDKAWDDVERKYKPIQTPQELRKKLVLDQEKSKESLAQIYEKEYRNQVEKINPREMDETEEEPKSHKEIKDLMRSLFIKLDALSNFHYTPKPATAEPRIITNTPAVEMEEVAPVAVSTSRLLAPEEIRVRAKGDLLGKTERSRTDKNRERRKKKIKQKIIGKSREEKLQTKQKLGLSLSTKEEKEKMLKNVMKHRNVQQMNANGVESSTVKSSKTFFTQLQEKVSSSKHETKIKKKVPKEHVSAKRLKL